MQTLVYVYPRHLKEWEFYPHCLDDEELLQALGPLFGDLCLKGKLEFKPRLSVPRVAGLASTPQCRQL